LNNVKFRGNKLKIQTSKMKRILLIILITTLCSIHMSSAQALRQGYATAIGVKVWDGGGITIKHFVRPNIAVEGIGYFWNRGARIVGLYQFHYDIAGAPGLKWYIGPGAHVGFYNNSYYNNNYPNGDGSGSYVGIDGVLGLDYKFDGIPLNISLDWQPSFEFGTNRGFINNWGGLGIRYAF
jgi:hypothetical protein